MPAGDEGTKEVVDKYKRDTPGQEGYLQGGHILDLIHKLMKEKKEKDGLPST